MQTSKLISVKSDPNLGGQYRGKMIVNFVEELETTHALAIRGVWDYQDAFGQGSQDRNPLVRSTA